MDIKKRTVWIRMIESAWKHRSVVWLSGIRRSGKTCLAQSLDGVEFFDCELPRVRRMLSDPEEFLRSFRKPRRIVLDEIHRLDNPSELLKIAADHYQNIKILATGSSTLGASAKFRDTLSGRKTEIWLTPMVEADLLPFGDTDLRRRLLHGGLPPFFLSRTIPERDFGEWMEAYWAKDIQELFRLERRQSFQKFAELLMLQSGGIFEATRFAGPCEISRTTVANYLSVMEATFLVHVLRPFSARRATEIISAPKVYAFDTGFVAYHRDWHQLRASDLGDLWEHYVLNELQGRLQTRAIQYWRNKSGHEIDFVIARRGGAPVAIECKWSADQFDPASLHSFRKQHSGGSNYVVCHDVDRAYTRTHGSEIIKFVGLSQLIAQLAGC